MRLAAAALLLFAACTRTLDLGEHFSECGAAAGSCRSGVQCASACASCFCNERQSWQCSNTCPSNSDGCPKEPPKDSSPCTTEARCVYANACGDSDFAACNAGKWSYFTKCQPTPATECPPGDEPPPIGKPCPSGVVKLECTFKNSCGLVYPGYCDASTPWKADPPPCDASCPVEAPIDGTPCDLATKCIFKNKCGTEDTGACEGGKWTIYRTCGEECLATDPAPPSGSPCKTEGLYCAWKVGCEGGTIADGWCKAGFWATTSCHP
ncbi:MAG: hypothetical protein ACXVEE_20925 [Polyangiales bacterium]